MKHHPLDNTDRPTVMDVSLALTDCGLQTLRRAARGGLPDDWCYLEDGERAYAMDLAAAILAGGDAARQRVWEICASSEAASRFAARAYRSHGADPFVYLGEIVLRARASRGRVVQEVGRLRLIHSTWEETTEGLLCEESILEKNDETRPRFKSDRNC